MRTTTIALALAVVVLGATASTATADRHAPVASYEDAIGDAGDAPDIARVTFSPVRAGLAVDVRLAGPTELGPYGWILVGLDTDRDPFTGGGRGDELLVLTNGESTTFARWAGGGFTADFPHHDIDASLSGTDLVFVLRWPDLGARSFEFSVASLREDADLAPGGGVATYPPARARARHRLPRRRRGEHPVRCPILRRVASREVVTLIKHPVVGSKSAPVESNVGGHVTVAFDQPRPALRTGRTVGVLELGMERFGGACTGGKRLRTGSAENEKRTRE
jgi:hypothetical protein